MVYYLVVILMLVYLIINFFSSDRAKSFCVSDVYDGLGGIANENKTDKHKKILYKECIRQWYERRKK